MWEEGAEGFGDPMGAATERPRDLGMSGWCVPREWGLQEGGRLPEGVSHHLLESDVAITNSNGMIQTKTWEHWSISSEPHRKVPQPGGKILRDDELRATVGVRPLPASPQPCHEASLFVQTSS